MMKSTLLHPQKLLLVLFLLLGAMMPPDLLAQIEKIVPRSQSSTMEGRHFYVGFMRNEIDQNRSLDRNDNDNYMYLLVFIGATEKTNVTFRYPWETDGTTYTIDGDSVLMIDIPQQYFNVLEVKTVEVPTYGIVEITTDKKTIVYGMNTTRLSTDAFTALPVSSWGKEYVVVSVPNDTYFPESRAIDTIPRSSEFMIMASEDSTLVQFAPTSETVKGNPANQLVSIYLMKGQCYLVASSQKLGRGFGDLTGTIIRSDKPIGVLTGHVRTSIPFTSGEPLSYTKLDSKDHLVDMLCPTNIWGKYYISTPFNIYSAGDMIRVVSCQPNTKVTAIGTNVFRDFVLANPGDVEDFYPVGVPVVWIADKPIQIAQFMPTSLQDAVQIFDPCMVILPPTEQFVSRILFEIPPLLAGINQEYFNNFVNIVCERSAIYSLTLDGTNILNKYPRLYDQQIPGTQYNWLVLPVKSGVHVIKADTGRFSGIIYGTAQEDSYALSLGISLLKTSIVDTTPPTFTFRSNCDKIHVTASESISTNSVGLDEVIVLKDSTFNYTWKIDSATETSTSLSVNAEPTDITKNGQIIIETRDKLGYGRQLKYVYNAVSLEMRSDIIFKTVNWKDSTCERVVIKNNGVDTVQFLGSSISGDARVNFNGIIPLVNQRLAPKDSVSFIVCFKPNSDPNFLNAILKVNMPCGREVTIPLSGEVNAPSIKLIGWDFGNVLLGDTACANVFLTNNGNLEYEVIKLSLSPFEPSFQFDTVGLFPHTLLPGDTLAIPVCFLPIARRTYTQSGSATNSLNLPNSTLQFVKGVGVAPLVEGVLVDWQKRRVGTVNDSLILLINTGNYNADLRFSSMAGDSAALSSFARLMMPTTLLPNDTLSIATRFIPDAVRMFQSKITATVSNWKLHNLVEINLVGEGTLPAISTNDIDFDTIKIREFKDSMAVVLQSGGNETLTIDKMQWVSGDSSAFVIAPSYFAGRKIPTGESYSMQIRFLGDTVGYYEATIAVIHDALPSYKRDTSYIKLTGFVQNADSSQFSLTLSVPSIIFACAPEQVVLNFKNTGNRPLRFQKISSIGTNIILIPISIPAAQTILPDSTLEATYSVEIQQGLIGKVNFTVQCNDTILEMAEATILPNDNIISIGKVPDISQSPGETIDVPVSGTISAHVAMPMQFDMSMKLNYQILDLLKGDGVVQLTDSNSTISIPVTLVQESNRVVIRSNNSFMLHPGITTWKIEVPFAVMLSLYNECAISTEISDTLHPCFTQATADFTVHINEVCANVFRKVAEAGVQFNLVRISPSPVGETGTAEITLQGDGVVRIDAVNQLGERMLIVEENLKSGRYEFQFSTRNFANGVYGMIVRAADGRERRATFVIQR